ncbi:phosphotransferase [Streptomyces sp. NPDC047974]|uniref:phosphotransferase n=1 Tax=Streptomyces sp. NPDC047974 TaxID=3154343 RepID=UPI0033EF4B4A
MALVATPPAAARPSRAPTGGGDPLDARGAVGLLCELGLLTAAHLVGGLVVTDVSRRNRNHRVTTTDGPAFLVKQAGDPDTARTLGNEARTYDALALRGSAELRAALPPTTRHLPERAVLVLGIDSEAITLAAYHRRTRRFPPGVAEALGRRLAALHALRDDQARELLPVTTGLPLVFSFDRPDVTVYYGASSATLRLLTAVHGTGDFADLLGRLRPEWRPGCVVHGDLRLDNVIVRPSVPARAGKGLRLADWEMAMWGDPAWDVATVLSEYLSLWLDHAPVSEATPPERFLDHGPFPLSRWQPAVQRFWTAYATAAGDPAGARAVWARAVPFAAARLVQTAYESTQFLAELPGQVVLKLQLAHNLLRDPAGGGRALLGIAP